MDRERERERETERDKEREREREKNRETDRERERESDVQREGGRGSMMIKKRENMCFSVKSPFTITGRDKTGQLVLFAPLGAISYTMSQYNIEYYIVFYPSILLIPPINLIDTSHQSH